jgi:ketosteroid isomerase-like protein
MTTRNRIVPRRAIVKHKPGLGRLDGNDGSFDTVQNLTAKFRISGGLLSIAAALLLAACASNTAQSDGAVKLAPVFAEPLNKSEGQSTAKGQATMIFYRPGSATFTGTDLPLNVYVNQRFLSSLLPGGYVEHINCPGSIEIAAVFDDARIRHLGKNGHEISVPIEAGKTYYFKLETNGSASEVKPVQVPADAVFLSDYRRQAHVLPRAPACVNVPEPEKPVAATPVIAPMVAAIKDKVIAPIAAERVRIPLEDWRAAWERGDFNSYVGFYAPDFKGTLKSHNAWLDFRRARLHNQKKKITLKDIDVSTAGDAIFTDFHQQYGSSEYGDQGKKRLVWKDFKGDLKITEETFAGK